MALDHPARFSPVRFIRSCRIIPAEGGQPIPFELWDFQEEVLTEIEKGVWLIFLKARQLGLTWLVLAYGLWLAVCNDYRTVLIVNRNLREAMKLLNRVRLMHSLLDDALRQEVIVDRHDELAFANGSRILSLPATPDTGSGETSHLVILDEWSKHPFAEDIFTAVTGTLAAGGQLIGIATAKGYANLFARTWMAALTGGNAFTPLFIPTTAHPRRDDAWREAERKKYDTERAFLQEHPETWQDAFQQPGETVFEEFDRAVHNRKGRDRAALWPVYRGVDFGHHMGLAIYFEVQGERHVHVFAEVIVRRGTTEELGAAMNGADVEHGAKEWKVVGADPAGVAKTSQSTESDHDVMLRYGYTVKAEREAPRDRVSLIKNLLGALVRDDAGHVVGRREVRFSIDVDACPVTTAALEQAIWEKRRGPDASIVLAETYPKDGTHEHPLDALGYGLINVIPGKSKPAGASSQNPIPVYSGSLYG